MPELQQSTFRAVWLGAVLAAAMVLTAGCTDKAAPESAEAAKPLVAETQSGDFLLRLVSEKPFYYSDEEVKLTAKLKYIGEKDRVTLSHKSSPFQYRIQEMTRGVDIPLTMEAITRETELKRDHWYDESFVKAGVDLFDEAARDNEFIRSFEESDTFPAGEYEIELNSDFYVQMDGEEVQQLVTTGLIITVGKK
ncbi:hypothetical protein [Alteribacter keqinensis]|uniref:Uncharacterized protein n=1 Tax=Alteribacter keqinensis TaxID=2483800 RepID=A0A3M7TU24_9BACI|nr:hypothetical protein [Alteribacter keqinensis]RNA68482.1 hypothetical protein EBO34_00460 [Alteribacter keqinensis]